MVGQRKIEMYVGLFLALAFCGLLILAFKVSGLTSFFQAESYPVKAYFDDIGGLKVRAPVKVGGVTVGEVSNIMLDPITFKAVVTLNLHTKYNEIPEDSSASILTAGLLGDNYIALLPSYSTTFLTKGSEIQNTHSAMILEKLIGQFMFKINNSDTKVKATTGVNNGKK